MENIISKYYRYRSLWWRLNRMLFPSPAETRFIELMGGRVLRVKWLRHYRTRFCFAVVLSMGKALRGERFKREVRAGKYFMDFGNDVGRAIEIDGHHWHMDIVKEFEREAYLFQHGWRLMRIPAVHLFNQPDQVQRDVLKFLYT